MKKTMKRFLSVLLITALILSGGVASVFAETLPPDQPLIQELAENQTIRILHTNDTHGRYQYQSWTSGGVAKNNAVFGFDRLKTLAKGDTETKPADLILDAGDTFHGQAFATLEEGESTAKVMKEVGYTATTPGNHDFNYTADVLKNKLEQASGASILSCNVKIKGTDTDYFTPYIDKTLENGVKVGILGITSPDIYSDTAPRNVSDLEFVDPIAPATQAVKALKTAGCTVIIALAHMGNSTELHWKTEDVAKQVDGIDLIVDGHTHVEDSRIVERPDGKNTLIAQTGYAFQNAGEVNMTLNAEKQVEAITTDNEKRISYKEAATIEPDQAVSNVIKGIEEQQEIILDKVIGETPVVLDGKWETVRYQQTNMGNLVTDAYINETGADVAFENAGGIRKERIEIGNIIQKDIIDLAPYSNYIVTKKITGQAILDMLEVSLQQGIDNKTANDQWVEDPNVSWPSSSGSFLQWGGIDVVQKLDNPKGQRVMSAEIGGKPLDPEKEYTVATNSMVSSSDGYKALQTAPELNQYGACDESIIKYIEQENNAWQKSLSANHFVSYQEKPETKPETKPAPVQNMKGLKNPPTAVKTPEAQPMIIALTLLAIMSTCGLLYRRKV